MSAGGAPGGVPGAADGTRVRGRVLSAWNSVRYGWSVRPKTHFSKVSPLHLLGRVYSLGAEEELQRFRRDFGSRLWLTYRRGFPALGAPPWSTDCGWGCTLRSAQMLLAQGLVLHLLGRDWMWPEAPLEMEPVPGTRRARDPPAWTRDPPESPRDPPTWTRDPQGYPQDPQGSPRDPLGWSRDPQGSPRDSPGWTQDPPKSPRDPQGYPQDPPGWTRDPQDPPWHRRPPGAAERCHRAIVSWLSDHPRAPFGIHRLVQLGQSAGRRAGDWYGPALAAHILRRAVETAADPPGLAVYVSQDCTVYKGDVAALARGGDSGSPPRAVIVLVPVRLGGDTLNPIYVDCLKCHQPPPRCHRPPQELLKLKSCVGIIGGKPRHSLYFVGFQDDFLLYLDPHYCQPVVDTSRENFPLQSFHCGSPRKMPFGKMDPSCTIGFYSGADPDAFCRDLERVLAPPSPCHPIFTLAEGPGPEPFAPPLCPPRPGKHPKKPNTEEFVFL